MDVQVVEELKNLFAEQLGIDKTLVTDDLEYRSIAEWDSRSHMMLTVAIENAFDIMLEPEDIIDMSDFGKAKEILAKYIGVK